MSSNNNNNRRQSVLGVTKDPRPLKDKRWVDVKIKQLLEYLDLHGSELSKIAMSLQNPPSTKTFHLICMFLFRQIDPTFGMNIHYSSNNSNVQLPFEDSCISFLSKLGYPFKINKSSLKCLAPHSWPALFGAISWITELLMYVEHKERIANNTEQKEQTQTTAKIKQNTKEENIEFLNQCCISYSDWLLNTKDDTIVYQELFQSLDADIEYTGHELIKFDKANAQLNIEMKSMHVQLAELAQLQDKRQSSNEKLQESKNFFNKREQYGKDLKTNLAKMKQKLLEIQEKHQKCNAQVEELRLILSQQTISAEDVKRINKQSQVLSESADEMQLKNEELLKNNWQLEHIQVKNEMQRFQEYVQNYSENGIEIQILPQTAKFAYGQNFEMDGCFSCSLLEDNKDITFENECRSRIKLHGKVCNSVSDLLKYYSDKLESVAEQKSKQQKIVIKCEKGENETMLEIKSLKERLSEVMIVKEESDKDIKDYVRVNTQKLEKDEMYLRRMGNNLKNIKLESQQSQFKVQSLADEKIREDEIYKETEEAVVAEVKQVIDSIVHHRRAQIRRLKSVSECLDAQIQNVQQYHIQEPTVNVGHSIINNSNML